MTYQDLRRRVLPSSGSDRNYSWGPQAHAHGTQLSRACGPIAVHSPLGWFLGSSVCCSWGHHGAMWLWDVSPFWSQCVARCTCRILTTASPVDVSILNFCGTLLCSHDWLNHMVGPKFKTFASLMEAITTLGDEIPQSWSSWCWVSQTEILY